MSFFSWLRSRTSTRSRRWDGFQIRPTTPHFRPRLEVLEDRCVPSTLRVSNFADSGKGSLRYEIAQAQSNDTIVFDFGNKHTPHTIQLYSGNELYIGGKNLTIQGPGAGLLTISAEQVVNTGTSRVFEVARGATVTLSGLTIRNGGGTASGAYPYPAQYDGLGGGILNFGSLTVSACTLSNNFANGSGGGAIANFAALTVSGCTLSNNSTMSGNGGGIYNGGTLTASGCILSSNSASSGYGGGIYNAGTATVMGSTLSGNTANSGAGMANFLTLTVSGCALSGNTAADATGENNGTSIALGGGGILNQGALTLSNSAFSANTPDNIVGSFIDGGGNIFN